MPTPTPRSEAPLRPRVSPRLPLAVVGAVVVGMAVGVHPLSAQTRPGLAAADSLVAASVEGGMVPGAVLLVLEDGRVVFERAYGQARAFAFGEGEYGMAAAGEDRPGALRRLADPVPMTLGTVFDLASVTKVMATTMALMLLVDRGEVTLDAPVSRWLPDFRGGGKEAVTLRHLLTHTSGLRQWVPTYYHAAGPDAAYAYLRDLPPGWGVGEGRHYSDLGFMVLGRAVEAVSGTGLDAFLERELYGPLGLEATGFRPTRGPFAATSHGNPFEHRMVHDPDFGYRIEGDADAWDGWRRYTLVGEVNDGNAHHAWRGVAGHAGLFSTARELAVLLRLLLEGGELDGTRYLGAEVVDAFLAESIDGQALGWQVPPWAPGGSFAHTGFTGTWVLGAPAAGLGVVLLTNRQHGGVDAEGRYPELGPLQRAVAEALLGR